MFHRALFLVVLFASGVGSAAGLNTTGVTYCESNFYACVNASFSAQNFTNCSAPFEACMGQNAYLLPLKSEDCFLAKSEWLNLKISTAFAVSVFVFSNLIFPAMLKAGAKSVNELNNQKGALKKIGIALLYFTDGDGDGKVTASELVTPQTIFAFGSVALPVYQWFVANDQQARCDYQKSLPPPVPPAA